MAFRRVGGDAGVGLYEFPVRGLLGEDAEVFGGVGEAGLEGEGAPLHGPFARGAGGEAPGAVFVMDGVGAGPGEVGEGRFPPGFGFAADDDLGAEAFELAAAAGVEEGVVGPAGGEDGEGRSRGRRSHADRRSFNFWRAGGKSGEKVS